MLYGLGLEVKPPPPPDADLRKHRQDDLNVLRKLNIDDSSGETLTADKDQVDQKLRSSC